MIQTRLLLGPGHWVVQVVHLLIGLVAMFVAARLVRFLRSNPRRGRVLAAGRPVTRDAEVREPQDPDGGPG
jgi:hypothetical protein